MLASEFVASMWAIMKKGENDHSRKISDISKIFNVNFFELRNLIHTFNNNNNNNEQEWTRMWRCYMLCEGGGDGDIISKRKL